MKFKEAHLIDQYNARPEALKEVCRYFEELSLEFGVEPVVTRVTDRVPGESGVHPAGRAVDFRDEFAPGLFLYSPEESARIVEAINERFPRTDGKKVCIHHSFSGGPKHFHIQIQA